MKAIEESAEEEEEKKLSLAAVPQSGFWREESA